MYSVKKQLIILSVATIIALGGCGNNTSQQSTSQPIENINHSDMNHSILSEVPKGLKEAKNPTYPVGSQAIIQADHMPGMKGATATIVGAYDTTAYTVSYTPTTGGQPVKNHKWVVQEEIKNAGTETLKPGTEVTLEADHMPGMKGATAKIDSGEHTTVYMVDYTPTTGGELVKNHKWVTESELSTK
ncbi:YdhK family protein [Brevibacillus halotolerans]|nr:YdhK family protein [Brevibacillus halotolerans]